MMKKILLSFMIIALVSGSSSFTREDNDALKQAQKARKKEEKEARRAKRQAEKARKKAQRLEKQHKRESKEEIEARKRLKKAQKEAERLAQKHKKEEREAEAARKKEQKRRIHARKKAEEKAKKDREMQEKKRRASLKRAQDKRAREEKRRKEQRRKEEEQKRRARRKIEKQRKEKLKKEALRREQEESERLRRLDKQARKKERARHREEKRLLLKAEKDEYKDRLEREKEFKKYSWRYEQEEKERKSDLARQDKKSELLETKRLLSQGREDAMRQWKKIRMAEVEQDYADGKYAYLFRRPAWPFYAYFTGGEKDILNLSLQYDYATTMLNSDGSSQDLSRLYFGEDDFTFEDILLASRLIRKGLVDDNGLNNFYEYGANGYGADKNVTFHAQATGYGASIDFARYLKGTDFLFGFQVPFGHKAHKLKLSSNVEADGAVTSFLENDILNYALGPKNLWYHPRTSITGIGDLVTFLSLQINTKYLERMIVGLKAIWPTSKDPDTRKLWAPSLGKGFTTVSWYGAVLFHHQRTYFNPHMVMELSYSWPAHKKRRVPKKIVNTQTDDGEPLSDTDFALSDKVDNNGSTFSEWDTRIPGFADHVRSVKITQGAEVNLRLGNIFEKVIWREAFVDLFYDFRAKFKDRIGSGLPRDLWDPDILKDNSHELEHRIGADFTYQFDAKTRLQTGFRYTFDGINVPETFEWNLDVNVEF